VSFDDPRRCRESGAGRASDAGRYATEFDRLLVEQLRNADVVGSLIRQAARLQERVRDQRAALRGLRDVLARLRAELQAARRAIDLSPNRPSGSQRSASAIAVL
jgi:hypothetical protein